MVDNRMGVLPAPAGLGVCTVAGNFHPPGTAAPPTAGQWHSPTGRIRLGRDSCFDKKGEAANNLRRITYPDEDVLAMVKTTTRFSSPDACTESTSTWWFQCCARICVASSRLPWEALTP